MIQKIESIKELKSFARHETFYPRYGWLTKIADKHSKLYDEGNHNELGVGKNMFNSMKFWGQAFKLVAKDGNVYNKTELNKKIFGSNFEGVDPFVETYETLWILMYESLLPTSILPAWRSIINLYNSEYFTANSLELHLKNRVKVSYPEISESSLKKDVHCFISMFVDKSSSVKSDEFILSPFSELGYIVNDIENDSFRFVYGVKPTLSSRIVVWSIVRYMENVSTSSISLSELCNREDSPGKVYKLSPNDISEYLDRLPKNYANFFQILESAGEKIFTYDTQKIKSNSLIKTAYGDK